jgi:large subunit ribosomal protein L29
MEKLKMREIREMSTDELKKRIGDEQVDLGHLKFQHATSRIQNTDHLRKSRRLIARMNTVIRERELGIDSHSAASAPKASTGTPAAKESGSQASKTEE